MMTGTVAVLVFVAFGGLVPFASPDRLVVTFVDDAFYYFQIARNVASGNGFTFDGIHRTNGFQPLWLFMLVCVFGLVPGDIAPLRAVALIETVLICLSAVGIFRCLRTRIGDVPALIGAFSIAALPSSQGVLRNGMESSLLLFLMVAIWGRWLTLSDDETPSSRRVLSLGLLAGLASFARAEAILIVPVLLISCARRWRMSATWVVPLLAPPVLLATIYCAWSWWSFGTPFPISALVKHHSTRSLSIGSYLTTAFGPPDRIRDRVCDSLASAFDGCGVVLLAFCWLVGLLIVLVAWTFRQEMRRAVRRSGAAIVLLTSALVVLADKLMLSQLEAWYRGPIVLSVAILGASLVAAAPRLMGFAAAVTVIVTLLQLPILAWSVSEPDAFYAYHRLRAAAWVRSNTTSEDRIGSWNAGMFGYFAQRHVVNLDGVVNNIGYYRSVIQDGDLAAYLNVERIGWLGDQACRGDRHPTMYLAPYGGGRLGADFDLVFQSFRVTATDGCPGYAVWRRRMPSR